MAEQAFVPRSVRRQDTPRRNRLAFESWRWLPVCVLAVGIAVGVLLFAFLEGEARQADRTRLDQLVRAVESDLDKQMTGCIHALNSGVALYDTFPDISRGAWRSFASTLDLPHRYPGVRGIGVIYLVPAGQKAGFVERVRRDGAPDFTLRNTLGAPEAPEDTSRPAYVITYIEPEPGNRPAVGLDIASESHRLEAADTARDLATPRMTRRIVLVQDGKQRPGFLLCMPFFRGGRPPATVEERREAIRGWIYAPFVAEEFVQRALNPARLGEVHLWLFEGDETRPENLVFTTAETGAPARTCERVTALPLAGQRFTLGWNRGPGFVPADRTGALWAGGLSIGIALLLAALVGNLQAIGRQARTLLELQGAELAQQKFALDQHAIVAVTDVNGTITYANDLFCQLSGYSREELLGSNHRILRSGLHPREYYTKMYQTLTQGKVWSGEFCNRSKHGQLYWVASTIVPVTDAQGAPIKYIAIRTDITARKLAEQRLRESQMRLASIFGALNEGIILFGPGMQALEFNAAAERLLGLTRGEIEAEKAPPGWRLLREDGQPIDLDECVPADTLRTGQARHGTVTRVEKPDRSVVWLSVNSEPILDASGAVQSVVCSLFDVTERRLAERALVDAAQRLRLAAEAADIGVWDWDLERGTVLWDARMFAIYGMPARPDGRIPYSDWADRVHPDDLAAQEASLRRTVELRGQGQRSFRIRRLADGSVRHLQAQELVLSDDSGQPRHVIGVNRDVTSTVLEAEKRLELEMNLEKARDDALAASRMKSEFLATMSHELRTPMNGIIGMANLLLQSPLEKKQQEMAQVLVNSADTLLTIINDILDFSKIEAGKLRIAPSDFNLRDVVEDIVTLLAPSARRKGLRFTAEIESSLGTGLHGDYGRIQQVLNNLLGNAIKFTERGEVRLSARAVRAGPKELRFRITVFDTGVGIPHEARDRLFQPFVQVDASTTRRFGGTGLGLAICRQLVSLMHGELGFESAEGSGSTFWFELTLPRASTSVLDAPRRGRSRAPQPSQGLGSGAPWPPGATALRLLVAEDNETNQIVARSLLEQLGHSVTLAGNGRAVLEQLIGRHFDAILMDCQMPVLDGYETTRRIRHGEVPGISPEIPIIALTAYAMPVDRARAIEAGMDDYVPKPLTSEALHAALVRCGLAPAESAQPAVSPQPAATAYPPPLLDPAQREKLNRIPTPDGPSVWARAVKVFLAEMPGRMAALHDHTSAGRFSELASLAHTVAGSAASIGSPALRSAALELEAGARQPASADVPNLLATANNVWIRLREELLSPSFR